MYLKYLLQNWNQQLISQYDPMLSMLVRLSLALQKLTKKQIFPYNIQPVLKKLQTLEQLFEENPNEYKPAPPPSLNTILPPPSTQLEQDDGEGVCYDEVNDIVFHFGKWSLGGGDTTEDQTQ